MDNYRVVVDSVSTSKAELPDGEEVKFAEYVLSNGMCVREATLANGYHRLTLVCEEKRLSQHQTIESVVKRAGEIMARRIRAQKRMEKLGICRQC